MNGHLYAIQFSNGTIKIGRGKNTDKRIASHKSRLAVLGLEIVARHSIACDLMESREAKALEIAGALPGVVVSKREWFAGLLFEDAVCALSAAASEKRPHLGDAAVRGSSREAIALAIRARIDAEKLSMRAWAIANKLDVRMVHRITGGSHAITLDTLDDVARALGTTAAELLSSLPEKSSSSCMPRCCNT